MLRGRRDWGLNVVERHQRRGEYIAAVRLRIIHSYNINVVFGILSMPVLERKS